jgi:hypothetical protein
MISSGPNSPPGKKPETKGMKRKKDIPPAIGGKILRVFLPKGESEFLAGDYEELYSEIARGRGKARAKVWYWIQIAKSVWAGVTVSAWWRFTMLKSYVTIA